MAISINLLHGTAEGFIMFYVISYDVADDARRNKVSETLLDYGHRIQYSVFECNLEDNLAKKMIERLKKIIIPEKDRIRIYSLCASCRDHLQWFGIEGPVEEPKVVII
jgi:CRISPR-associated protein Cas2